MNRLRPFIFPVAGLAMLGLAWQSWGWKGVALVAGGLVMWTLLHFNRTMAVLGKAAQRPKGFVGSAVMLNAKLQPGFSLMHVITMTQSIGEAMTVQGVEPEVFRWHDEGGSWVDCEFERGRLARWSLVRPPEPVPPARD